VPGAVFSDVLRLQIELTLLNTPRPRPTTVVPTLIPVSVTVIVPELTVVNAWYVEPPTATVPLMTSVTGPEAVVGVVGVVLSFPHPAAERAVTAHSAIAAHRRTSAGSLMVMMIMCARCE